MRQSDFYNSVKEKILTYNSITSLVGDRVYGSELAEIKDTIFPCVCFSINSSSLVSDLNKASNINFRIWAWSGASREEADDVYDAVYSVLHSLRFSDVDKHFVVRELSRPISTYNTKDELYVFMGRWYCYMIQE